jgi:enoyl-CoA hydratase/carnithine racemase
MAPIRVEISAPIAWVILDRPEQGNPIDDELIDALSEVWSTLAGDTTVRAIGIAAVGAAFSVGVREGFSTAGRSFGPKSCGCPTPVLVELQGDIGSGAFQLVGDADVVVAADDVCFTAPNDPRARIDVLGLRPRLAEGQILRLVLLGPIEPLGAVRAAQLGVIDELVPRAHLHERSLELLLELAGVAPHS